MAETSNPVSRLEVLRNDYAQLPTIDGFPLSGVLVVWADRPGLSSPGAPGASDRACSPAPDPASDRACSPAPDPASDRACSPAPDPASDRAATVAPAEPKALLRMAGGPPDFPLPRGLDGIKGDCGLVRVGFDARQYERFPERADAATELGNAFTALAAKSGKAVAALPPALLEGIGSEAQRLMQDPRTAAAGWLLAVFDLGRAGYLGEIVERRAFDAERSCAESRWDYRKAFRSYAEKLDWGADLPDIESQWCARLGNIVSATREALEVLLWRARGRQGNVPAHITYDGDPDRPAGQEVADVDFLDDPPPEPDTPPRLAWLVRRLALYYQVLFAKNDRVALHAESNEDEFPHRLIEARAAARNWASLAIYHGELRRWLGAIGYPKLCQYTTGPCTIGDRTTLSALQAIELACGMLLARLIAAMHGGGWDHDEENNPYLIDLARGRLRLTLPEIRRLGTAILTEMEVNRPAIPADRSREWEARALIETGRLWGQLGKLKRPVAARKQAKRGRPPKNDRQRDAEFYDGWNNAKGFVSFKDFAAQEGVSLADANRMRDRVRQARRRSNVRTRTNSRRKR